MGIALCGGHHAFGHVGEATGIKQRGDVPIVAEGLARQIDRTTRSVEDTDLITKLLLHQSMHVDTQVTTGPYITRDRIERMGQDDGSCQRGWQYRQQGLAQGGQVGMREGGLEFTHPDGERLFQAHVKPSLLQQRPTRSGCVEREVEGHFVECLTRESQDRIGNGEAGIGDIVLVIGRIQPLVIVIVDVGTGLHQQVGLEQEVSLLAADREALFTGQGDNAVFGFLLVLGIYMSGTGDP